MKNTAIAILALAMGAAAVFGVVSHKNLAQTRALLETERTERILIASELESTQKMVDASAEERKAERDQQQALLSRAETAEAMLRRQIEALENRFQEQAALLRAEVDALNAQRSAMAAEISAIRQQCDSRTTGLEESLRHCTEEADALRQALAQAQRQTAASDQRAASEKAAMIKETAQLHKALEVTEARCEAFERQTQHLRRHCEDRVRDLTGRIESKEREISHLVNALAKVEREAGGLEDRIQALTEIWETRLDNMKAQVSELSAADKERDKIEALLEAERTKSDSLTDHCSLLEARAAMLAEEVSLHSDALRRIASQLEDERYQSQMLSENYAAMDQIAMAFQAALAECETAVSELAEGRQDCQQRVLQLDSELQNALGTLDRLEAKIMDTSSTMADLRHEAQELRHKAQQTNRELETVRDTYETLVTELRRELVRREVRIERLTDMISVEVVNKILFPTGSATITPEGERVLLKVGDILKTIPDRPIRVVGHTDNIPIKEVYRWRYPTNWELSAARACSVVRFFQHQIGMPPTRFEAVGRSFYEPIAQNETAEGRALNRRVTIVIGPKLEIP